MGEMVREMALPEMLCKSIKLASCSEYNFILHEYILIITISICKTQCMHGIYTLAMLCILYIMYNNNVI